MGDNRCYSEEVLFGHAIDLEEGRTIDNRVAEHLLKCDQCLKTFKETQNADGTIRKTLNDASPPQFEQDISPFELDFLLGEGGMGQVWKGRDTLLERAVAIKIIRPGMLDGKLLKERLLQEARSLSKLNHPNIVQVYQVLDRGEHLLLVM